MPADAQWPQSITKRVLDAVFAGGLLLILSPLMGLIGLVLWLRNGMPVFFRQLRPGRKGLPFLLVKFRTLSGASEAENEKPEAKTPSGGFTRFLRASGLDELPELWNILKGDMSFVGPRPLLMRYLPRYNPEQQRRHAVRPGLTGLAQVKGRNALEWEERLAWDVRYVSEADFKMDLQILWQTLRLIGRGEGTSEPGEFWGTARVEDPT